MSRAVAQFSQDLAGVLAHVWAVDECDRLSRGRRWPQMVAKGTRPSVSFSTQRTASTACTCGSTMANAHNGGVALLGRAVRQRERFAQRLLGCGALRG